MDRLFVHGTPYRPKYAGASLPIPAVNVLAQPRKTFEGIPELALDVAKKRLLNPPTVARFDEAACRQYVEAVNRLWETSYCADELQSRTENGERVYYVLLAGERRFRSCRLLWNEGCAECVEARGKEKPGRCFKRHFGCALLDVRVCRNIPPLAALFLQLSENTHVPVPSHEEAAAYARLFALIRKADPEFPVARFAREVGRSPDTIRKALRYHLLPPVAKEAVENGAIAYGVAIEIARLQEDGLQPEQLEFWIARAITERRKVKDFRGLVTAHIQERHSGQTSLLDFFQAVQAKDAQRAHLKRTVEANSIQALWAAIHYLGRVQRLFTEELLGPPKAPYSISSPVRVYRTLVERLRELLPAFRARVSARRLGTPEPVLAEAALLLGLLVPEEAGHTA